MEITNKILLNEIEIDYNTDMLKNIFNSSIALLVYL